MRVWVLLLHRPSSNCSRRLHFARPRVQALALGSPLFLALAPGNATRLSYTHATTARARCYTLSHTRWPHRSLHGSDGQLRHQHHIRRLRHQTGNLPAAAAAAAAGTTRLKLWWRCPIALRRQREGMYGVARHAHTSTMPTWVRARCVKVTGRDPMAAPASWAWPSCFIALGFLLFKVYLWFLSSFCLSFYLSFKVIGLVSRKVQIFFGGKGVVKALVKPVHIQV